MTLPPTTNKQTHILQLLYRFRFLEQKQIQQFLHHKDNQRTGTWLRDLIQKQYIGRIYDETQNNQPARYYLGLNGIRFLTATGQYVTAELRKRYADASRERSFVDHCVLIAQSCIGMEARNQETGRTIYSYETEADYRNPDSDYYFILATTSLRPDLCYTKTLDDQTQITNLLAVFDALTPRYMLRSRIKKYVSLLDEDAWEADGQLALLLCCPDRQAVTYAKRCARQWLAAIYDKVPGNIHVRIATAEQLKCFGVTGRIWEEVTVQ